jgi:hypothetical protein
MRKIILGHINASLYQLIAEPDTQGVQTEYVFGRIYKQPQPNSVPIYADHGSVLIYFPKMFPPRGYCSARNCQYPDCGNKCSHLSETHGAAGENPVKSENLDKCEAAETAIELLAAERERQVRVEGFDQSHDDNNWNMAAAAAAYAQHAWLSDETRDNIIEDKRFPEHWPWPAGWWKPTVGNEPQHRIRDLVKAGALIVAEIERLQRLQAKQP